MAMPLTTVLALVARHLRRLAPQPRRRRRRDGGQPDRHRDPELLVRDPADLAVRGEAALVLGRRLSRLERRRRRRPAGPACARCSCRRSRWPSCRPRSSRASRARRCSTCCARTSCAPRAPRACRRARVLWRHVLRNAFVPVLTVIGLQFANLLTGTIVIEHVFSLPGLGRLVFQAIANRDLVRRPERRDAARRGRHRHQLRRRRAVCRDRSAPEACGAA